MAKGKYGNGEDFGGVGLGVPWEAIGGCGLES